MNAVNTAVNNRDADTVAVEICAADQSANLRRAGCRFKMSRCGCLTVGRNICDIFCFRISSRICESGSSALTKPRLLNDFLSLPLIRAKSVIKIPAFTLLLPTS